MGISSARLVAGTVMAVAGLAIGFFAGGLVAARFVGSGAALADAATVALVAVGCGIVVAGVAVWWVRRASPRTLLPGTLFSLALAGVLGTVAVVTRPPRRGAAAGTDTSRFGQVATSAPLPVTGGDSLLGLMRIGATGEGSGLLPAPLDLRGGPGREAAVLTTVTRWSDLVAEEVSYEEPAIAVYRVAHPWYLVATRDSVYGWVELPAGGTVVPLVELLPDRLSYLTAAWNGVLHAAPGDGSGTTVEGIVRDHGEASVEVHEARQVGDALWLRVSVHRESPCETAGEVEVAAEGWVPAWTRGRPTVWYYSRGC